MSLLMDALHQVEHIKLGKPTYGSHENTDTLQWDDSIFNVVPSPTTEDIPPVALASTLTDETHVLEWNQDIIPSAASLVIQVDHEPYSSIPPVKQAIDDKSDLDLIWDEHLTTTIFEEQQVLNDWQMPFDAPVTTTNNSLSTQQQVKNIEENEDVLFLTDDDDELSLPVSETVTYQPENASSSEQVTETLLWDIALLPPKTNTTDTHLANTSQTFDESVEAEDELFLVDENSESTLSEPIVSTQQSEKTSLPEFEQTADTLLWDAALLTAVTPTEIKPNATDLTWDEALFAHENATIADKQHSVHRILSATAQPRSTQHYGLFAVLGCLLAVGGGIAYYNNMLHFNLPSLQADTTHTSIPLQAHARSNFPLPSTQTTITTESIITEQPLIQPATAQLNTHTALASLEKVIKFTTSPLNLFAPKADKPAKKPPVSEAIYKPSEPPRQIAVETDTIKIRRSVANKSNISTDLTNGYTAFKQGNDNAAYQYYRTVLQQDENNRDALLGMAAIASKQAQPALARQYYQRILRQYPQDRIAQAGLIAVLPEQDIEQQKNQLNLLLRETPQSAYLHFSLGNLYVKQGQWRTAQESYFEAYRYDKKQADYAYNLAVSLEHINQPALALSYYMQAVALAAQQSVSFDIQTTQQHIIELNTYAATQQTSALSELATQQ
ncbi:tetratricopeptide repeat protein [Beggiatoa leptomitoformis]|uniref:Tetratricopeptide repeat protein n=1 Tax=Beggiatoa leptomitoformis TaxID=288004 RepID=A0A2N9YDP1_9GAMM|nr:tetratricopeptide repeat protein [Beggiatoa leptomitoformis]AUI68601.1 tetratricopeptide repeat protein [Beggiatoa leptomitoformis]QGX03827.1 tetratricopeptide repeat protein [Beggiatoa leptomitoformis]